MAVNKDAASSFVDASTYGIEKLILSDYKNENENETLSFVQNHTGDQMDSYTLPDNIAGRDCFKNQASSKADGSGTKLGNFYIPVSPLYIDQTMRNVAIEVTYYDDDLGSLSL